MFNDGKKECSSLQEDIVRLAFKESRFYKVLAIKKHLRLCADCRTLYDSYSSMAKGLASLPGSRLPEHALSKVWQSTIGQQVLLHNVFQPTWRWVSVSLAALLVCLVIYRNVDRPPRNAYSDEEILKARTQVQTALGIFGKTMSDTRSTMEHQLWPGLISRPVQNSLYLALKPFKLGE